MGERQTMLFLTITLAFVLSCISITFAIDPIVLPVRKFNHHYHKKSSGNHQKRSYHAVAPIHFEENEFYDETVKGRSFMVGFYISHFIGTPPQQINTLIDTGSSNLAISCSPSPKVPNFFDPLNSTTYFRYHNFYASAQLRYADGEMGGDLAGDLEWIATVNSSTLSPYITDNMTIADYPPEFVKKVAIKFACIMYSTRGIFITSSWQGVMGMAYGTIVKPSTRYETFFDALTQQAGLPNVFTLQLCGLPLPNHDNSGALRGNLIFGGGDSRLQSTPIMFTKLVTQSYYGIIVSDMLVNDQSLGLPCTNYNDPVSIIDSGTSNWLVPQLVYDSLVPMLAANIDQDIIQSSVPIEFWTSNTQLCIPSSTSVNWNGFPTITLHVAMNVNGSTNQVFALLVPPSSYIRIVGTSDGSICYQFAIHPVNGSIVNSIIGLVVLEGLYLQFDRSNAILGFAQSAKCDNDNDNGLVHPRISGPIDVNYSTAVCMVALPSKYQAQNTALIVVGIILGAVVVVTLVIFVVFTQTSAYSSPYSPIGTDSSLSGAN